MKTCFVFATVFFFSVIKTNAIFSQQVVFNKVSPPDGNSWGTVLGIAQDKQGYMWFACTQGLYRYDGYNVVAYKHNPLNPNSISNDFTECICIDHNGIIWVGHKGSGLDRFDPKTGIFTNFHNVPSDPASLSNDVIGALLEDSKGVLWIGTHGGGLDKLVEQTGKFTRYEYKENDSSSLSNNTIRALYEDKQGTLWIGTGEPFFDEKTPGTGGLNKMDKATGKFVRYLNDPKDPHSLVDNRVRAIFEDSKKNFWIGTAGDGLHIMNREKGTFERYPYDPLHPDKLSRPPVKGIFDHITFITEDATGSIWIGTLNAGLSKYDPKTQRITHYENASNNQVGYSDVSAWWGFTSAEDIFWISTWGGENIYRVDPFQKNLPYSFTGEGTSSVIEKSPGIYWIGIEGGGLLLKDSIHKIHRQYQYDSGNSKSLSNNDVILIRKDRQSNNLWIATSGGLNLFDVDKQTFTRYTHDSSNDKSLADDKVSYVYQDHEDELWVGTRTGLDLFDRKTSSFIHYQINPADTSKALSHISISKIFEDRQHSLWVGTWYGGGLYRLDYQTGKFKHYLNSSISGMCEDGEGNLWVGATDNLYLYNRNTDDFSLYVDPKSNTGITSILCLLQDDEKNIWISTSSSIIQFDKSKNKLRVFGKNYGVHQSFDEYSDGFIGEKGNVIFPDETGFYSFNPKELESYYNSKPPQIHITDFKLTAQSNTDTNHVLKLSVDETKEIKLDYKQNAFSLSFVAIHYGSPENNRHLFMLENYDNNWRQATSERTAYYYNVPPGHYIFHVKAASSDGVWAEKSISIIITPPWWRTWLAYCM
jgi:ligand-binding sensor domain-containing protein